MFRRSLSHGTTKHKLLKFKKCVQGSQFAFVSDVRDTNNAPVMAYGYQTGRRNQPLREDEFSAEV